MSVAVKLYLQRNKCYRKDYPIMTDAVRLGQMEERPMTQKILFVLSRTKLSEKQTANSCVEERNTTHQWISAVTPECSRMRPGMGCLAVSQTLLSSILKHMFAVLVSGRRAHGNDIPSNEFNE